MIILYVCKRHWKCNRGGISYDEKKIGIDSGGTSVKLAILDVLGNIED